MTNVPSGAQQAQVAALTALNFQDFLNAVGGKDLRYGRRLAAALFEPAARSFARQVAECDRITGEQGLAAGSNWLFRQFGQRLRVAGAHHIPSTGPVMIASNHPGATDTLALFASIPRLDLATIASDRPFLRALPNIHAHLVNVSEAIEDRMLTVRTVAREFRCGRAILTFPAGKIEPDPRVLPGAVASLDQWSASIGVFARLVPGLCIVPAIVSGVLSPRALNSPLTRLRRQAKDRELMAAMLQIVMKRYHNIQVDVAFGEAVYMSTANDVESTTHTVIASARHLIEQPPTQWETLIG